MLILRSRKCLKEEAIDETEMLSDVYQGAIGVIMAIHGWP